MRFTLAFEPRRDCAAEGWAEARSDVAASVMAVRRDEYFTVRQRQRVTTVTGGSGNDVRADACDARGPHRQDDRTRGASSAPLPGQRLAKTLLLPALSNETTSYFWGVPPSMPGEPVTIPGTASPTTSAGRCATSLSTRSDGTCPSITYPLVTIAVWHETSDAGTPYFFL